MSSPYFGSGESGGEGGASGAIASPFAPPTFCFLLVVSTTSGSSSHTITPSPAIHQTPSARQNARKSSRTLRPPTTTRIYLQVDKCFN